MNELLTPALIALFAGGALAVVLIVPFVAASYRRRGGLSFWRSVGWLAFLIYMLAIWCYTLLPIPSSADYRASGVQLDVMDGIRDIANYPHASVQELVRNTAVLQLALNVVLFIPFGFLMRTLFQRGFFVATLSGFALSLLIETTQLTAVWGLFPRPYRVFDVGDLATNTLGALVGSLLAFVFVGFARREEVRQREPRPVTAGRRFLGFICDLLFLGLLGGGLVLLVRAYRATALGQSGVELAATTQTEVLVGLIPIAIQFLCVMIGGVTVGESAVMLAPVYHRVPAILSRLLRFVFGLGGYVALTTIETPVTAVILPFFVLASIIGVWATRDRRGLADALAGSSVADKRLVSHGMLRDRPASVVN
ncbi:VanZ family protein [Mycetocola lacteus]|uniref:VanZ family protein n=1 Tax=Mycetocola lacteus TaxID=76637 RepID=A0A3L7AWT9_9MICO|nr:VanZ family protein [Mycetocola lacteus]RLP84018.1 VanZ family protein [Mycetocola lacteus]